MRLPTKGGDGPPPPDRARLRNPVLALLCGAAGLAASGLAFLSQAPNRLLTGHGISLLDVMRSHPGLALLCWLPAAWLVCGSMLAPSRRRHLAMAAAAGLLLLGLSWLAGTHASELAKTAPRVGRSALGGGFWCLAMISWLAATDALRRAALSPAARLLAGVGVLLPVIGLAACGALADLSLFKEHAQRATVFREAGLQHLQMLGFTLLASLIIGLPLGIAVQRRPRFQAPVLALLNGLQTLPSIALFALLMAPLNALSALFPGWGLHGIGMAPAVMALVLYALLPIVHSAAAGLRQVPADARFCAAAMGMSPRQLFWQVELPLALPVWLSGLRVSAVQAIGLIMVAALIGAGGMGAIMFQGLLSSAMDLVLLGVLPVVALALAADAGLRVLSQALQPRGLKAAPSSEPSAHD